jgi:hypothetical protein
MRTQLIYAIALPVVLLVVASGMNATLAKETPSQHASDAAEISQPDGWVPFEADLQQTDQTGKVTLTGKFYRSADGSERLESGDGVHTVISIKNIPLETMFVYGANLDNPQPDSGWMWRSYRMELPPKGWHPLRYRENAYVTRSPQKLEGMQLYELSNPDKGNRFLMAPDLNFFRVVEDFPSADIKRSYTNIKKGDQPAHLFMPPPGVEVQPRNKVAGIRRHTSNH